MSQVTARFARPSVGVATYFQAYVLALMEHHGRVLVEKAHTHIVCKAQHYAPRGSPAMDEKVKTFRTRAHRMQTCSHFAQLQEQPTSILCEKLNTLLQGVAELWLKIVQLCCPVELHGRG